MQSRFYALVFTCLAACATPRGGDPLPLVPAAAENVLIVPSVADLQQGASSFLAGIEGTSGLLELAADRFGLDLRTPEGPAKLGLDPARGLALYTLPARGQPGVARPSASLRTTLGARQDAQPGVAPEVQGAQTDASTPAVVAAVSVARPDTFREVMALRLTRSAGLTPGPEATPHVFTSPGVAVAVGLVDTPEGQLGLLVVAPDQTDATALWHTAATRPATPFIGSARDPKPEGAHVLRFAWRFDPPEAPDELGLLRGIIDNITARLSAWEGSIFVHPHGLKLSMTTAHVEDATPLPVAWVNPEKLAPSRLADVVPRTTTALVRFRVNLDKVRALPGFVRNNMIPEQLPGLESFPLPSTADLIQQLDGDLGVALLGLAPSAKLVDLSNPRRVPNAFRIAFAAGLRDPAAFKRTYAAIAEQLATSGWTVAPLRSAPLSKPIPNQPATPWTGWTFVQDGRHFSVLHDDQVAVFVVGDGEVDAFLAVREGRALSLSTFSIDIATPNTPTLALGLTDTPGFFGLIVNPLRLTRELAARNVPPYFLKIVNEIMVMSAAVSATSDTVRFNWELYL